MAFGDVVAHFGADTTGFSSGIRSMTAQSSSFASHINGVTGRVSGGFKSMLSSAVSFASGQAMFTIASRSVSFFTGQLEACMQESKDAQEELAQTNAILKSTGGVSGMTANAITDLATRFSHLTKFTDDQVQTGENMLLTFTNIGKNVFPQATEAMLNMSQVMGGDTKNSAIMLGKALNDPITGMSALRRVGVTFSASQQQQVKDFMAVNNLAGAQGVILKELQREFGGTAVAAGKTFAGQMAIARQSLDDVRQKIGDALLPILERLTGWINKNVMPRLIALSDWMSNTAIPAIAGFVESLGTFFSQLSSGDAPLNSFAYNLQVLWGIIELVGQKISAIFAPAWDILVRAFRDITGPLTAAQSSMQPFGVTLQNIAGVIANFDVGPIREFVTMLAGALVQAAIGYIDGMRKNFEAVGTILFGTVIPAVQQMWPTFVLLVDALKPLGPVLLTVLQAASQLADVIRGAIVTAFQTFVPIIVNIVTTVGPMLADVIRMLTPAFQWAAAAIKQFVSDLGERLGPAIQNVGRIIGDFVNGVLTVWRAVWPSLAPILSGVFEIIFGIIKIAWAIISGLFKVALDILGGNWGRAWDDMKDMFKGVWDGIITILKGAWDVVQGIFNAILRVLGAIWKSIWDNVTATWNGIWKTVTDWITRTWHTIEDIGGRIFTAVMKPFRDFGAGVGGILKGAVNTIISWLNIGIDRLNDFIQFFARGINSISTTLGAGIVIRNERPIDKIKPLAQGTDYWQGGMAMVGERGRELAYLPRGTAVLPHRETERVVKQGGLTPRSIPGFETGLGDIWNWVLSGVSSIGKNIINTFGSPPKLPGFLDKIGGAVIGKITGWIGTYVNHLMESMTANVGNLPMVNRGQFVLPPGGGFHQMYWYGVHQGMDLQFPQGSALREIIGGQVLGHTGWYPWGGQVDVAIPGGLWERYEHLSQIFVKAGEIVHRGQMLGLTGGGTPASGLGYWSTGAHLHVQYDTGNYGGGIDPLRVWAAFNIFKPFGRGGVIREPILGFGLHSGGGYSFGERGPETITPGIGGGGGSHLEAVLESIERKLSHGAPLTEYQVEQALMRLLSNGVR